MDNKNFILRDLCPACRCQKNTTIYACGFLQSPVKEYLKSFYGPQGYIPFDALEGAQYMLSECNDCGLIFQKQILNDNTMRALYDEWIDSALTFASRGKIEDAVYTAKIKGEIATIIAYLKKSPSNLSFLDFGMGWGKWCSKAQEFGCNVYGLELSDSKVQHGTNCGIKIVTRQDLAKHQFDVINAEEVFEHIPNPYETLLYLKNILRPGGLIKICVPDGFDIKRRLKIMDWSAPKGAPNSLNPVAPLEHINCFNRENLIKMAQKAGMKIVKIPVYYQIIYGADLRTMRQAIRSILVPIKRNWLSKGTYIFLKSER